MNEGWTKKEKKNKSQLYITFFIHFVSFFIWDEANEISCDVFEDDVDVRFVRELCEWCLLQKGEKTLKINPKLWDRFIPDNLFPKP